MSQQGNEHERHDQEHERRFLVSQIPLGNITSSEQIEQGYLWAEAGYAIRIRRTWAIDEDGIERELEAFLTVKGPRRNATRWEEEMEISPKEAQNLIELAPYRITKTRHGVVSEGNTWVLDVFHEENDGLLIAEFEASKQAVAVIRRPWWCEKEVTDDNRYDNEALAMNPWPLWES